MKKEKTTDDLIKEYLTEKEAEQLYKEIDKEVEEIRWGGKRKGAGRKPKTGKILNLCVKVTEKEKEFIDYARAHHLDYDKLMQG